ncbi:hypothetical protein MJ561_14830 [Klebsiella pneumoniae]|nr:hypothetical protein MJ561_14830 [Klebsiella pneumoniae]
MIANTGSTASDARAAMRRAGFCTGDLGHRRRRLAVHQRPQQDMINRGGEKIYSLELESASLPAEGVREVAVIPTPARSPRRRA